MVCRPYFYIELCQLDKEDNVTFRAETLSNGYATPLDVPVGKYVLRLRVTHYDSYRPLEQHKLFKYSGAGDFDNSIRIVAADATRFHLIVDRLGRHGDPEQTLNNGYNYDSNDRLVLLEEFEVKPGRRENMVILQDLELKVFFTATTPIITDYTLPNLSVDFTVHGILTL